LGETSRNLGKLHLTFGKYKDRQLSEIPHDYLKWLAYNNDRDDRKFTVPTKVAQAAKAFVTLEEYAVTRLGGQESDRTDYVVRFEEFDDDAAEALPFLSLDSALSWLRTYVGYPDPEDPRITIWEVLPSGHRKCVWQFAGWHWLADDFPSLGQGCYLGDDVPVYSRSCNEEDDGLDWQLMYPTSNVGVWNLVQERNETVGRD
jgi:hypothetical protein